MLNVLVVEDDPAMQETYAEILADEGYVGTIVGSSAEAKATWETGDFDVVLLDKRLQGGSGPDDGVDLLESARFSTAKVLLVTGFADEGSIRRAFRGGAYDYLVKDPLLPTLLTAKLSQIRETVRAQQRGRPVADALIRQLWSKLGEGSAHAKGRRLEELILMFMTSVPGLLEAGRNLRTPAEELDVAIRNESTDPFWSKQPAFILCEAKNWTKSVGTPEVGWFATKVQDRPGALGFFFAAGGFTGPVYDVARTKRTHGLRLVLVDRSDMEELVMTDDRNEVLKKLVTKAELQ
ncbi:MAG: response regulator [Deltaproteobacteria bacterium]|jgi:CheY-like chemotaxis protein